MSPIRCLPFLAAAACCAASAQPLHAATAWMAEAQPYGRAAIERHFGKVEWRCAGVPGAFECMAGGTGIDMRWRADKEGGAGARWPRGAAACRMHRPPRSGRRCHPDLWNELNHSLKSRSHPY